jgi:hypothetical protein
MKTKILSIVSLLIILFLSSCTPQKVDEQREINYAINGEKLQILVIDSCEYIFCPAGTGSWCTHKGNCKFCKERNRTKIK